MPARPVAFSIESLRQLSDRFDRLIEGRLWLKVLIALGLGVVLGLLLGPDLGWFEERTVRVITAWLALPGQLFLALIQMIVVPLVIASIVRGLAANNDPQALRKIGGVALLFIGLSTVLATVIGISVGQLIQPGNHIEAASLVEGYDPVLREETPFPELDELPGKVLSLLPRNPLASMVSGEMLQVVLFAAVLGFALLSMSAKQAQPLYDLLGALQEVCIRVVSWAMRLAPLAVFGLMSHLVANLGLSVLAGMLLYVITVLVALIGLVLVYLLVVRSLAGIKIGHFIDSVRELLLMAFSTSSSAAVMPLTLQVTEKTLHIRPGIAQFLVPLGATINMAGTAVYQGVATVFLSQAFGVELSFTSYLFVITMAVAASIGSPATPGAGVIILAVVLEGVGIPAAGVALLMGVDRILDMCRTAVNVLGDVVACTVAEHLVPDTDASASPQQTP